MVKLEVIKPYCVDYHRHEVLFDRFRDEWKRDNIIFDLLTVIQLFSTPRRYNRTIIRDNNNGIMNNNNNNDNINKKADKIFQQSDKIL